MPKVKGKEQLCSCENYKTNFKSVQGLGNHTLFERYSDIENIVNKKVDEKYRHFLAQPEIDGDTIFWFSIPYSEMPRRLSDLQGEEHATYENIKNDTLGHYKTVITALNRDRKKSEAECLENAIKFVNDDFVYCFDGKTVLGIWGMQLRDIIRKSLGVAMKNATFKVRKRQEPPVKTPPEPPRKEPIEDDVSSDLPSDEEEEVIPPSPDPFRVHFNAGENGAINGISDYLKAAGESVQSDEIPEVQPEEGYEFIGWDKNPNDYLINEDTEFLARYREIPVVEESWCSRWGFWGKGCLNWLLLLLLLALIFMVIWCGFLKKCNFNFCGCDCDDTTVVIPEPNKKTNDNQDVTPNPVPNPSTGDIQFLLKWNNSNDLDLSCVDPSGTNIWYKNKKSPTGGQLEIDMNAAGGSYSENPIENIFWPSGGAPEGEYKVYLTYYAKQEAIDDTPYTIIVKNGKSTKTFKGTIKKSDHQISICSFIFTK